MSHPITTSTVTANGVDFTFLECGSGPLALARAQRAQTARILIETTSLPITEVAFASGFQSVRQFNDTVREFTGDDLLRYRTTVDLRWDAPSGRLYLLAVFVPFSYFMDAILWRQYLKRNPGAAGR